MNFNVANAIASSTLEKNCLGNEIRFTACALV